jgi:hypothetical protein
LSDDNAGLAKETTTEHAHKQPYRFESAEQRLQQLGAAAKVRIEAREVTDCHHDILLVAQALDIGALRLEARPLVVEQAHVYRIYAENVGGRGTRRPKDGNIDKWINSGGKRGAVTLGAVEAHQRPRSLLHDEDVVLTKRRGRIVNKNVRRFPVLLLPVC